MRGNHSPPITCSSVGLWALILRYTEKGNPLRWDLALRWRYYRWRLETYTGMPADDITWHTVMRFIQCRPFRQACWRFLRWRRQMRRETRKRCIRCGG